MVGGSPEVNELQVSASSRIEEILGDDFKLDEGTFLSYTWDHGYEKVKVEYESGGILEYAGSFHPGSSCETEATGVCRWCGRTVIE